MAKAISAVSVHTQSSCAKYLKESETDKILFSDISSLKQFTLKKYDLSDKI